MFKSKLMQYIILMIIINISNKSKLIIIRHKGNFLNLVFDLVVLLVKGHMTQF